MTSHAYFNDAYASRADDFGSGDFETDDDVPQDAFVPGERICAPATQVRGSTMLPAAIVIAVMLTAAWATMTYRATLEPIWTAAASITGPAVERLVPRPVVPEREAAAAPAAGSPSAAPAPQTVFESRDVAAVPGADAGTPAPVVEVTAETAAAETEPGAAPERLPPPKVDPADAYQKRAAAVGLHPDLSRALLARLTTADYRNAGIAIKTAMEATDTTVVVWPQKAEQKLAVFEVRFVHAAAPECRRYVVTVTKDRWQTTAPAMETCGTSTNRKSG